MPFPFVCFSIRSIIRSPSGPGTRNPDAIVAAFAKKSASLSAPPTPSPPARNPRPAPPPTAGRARRVAAYAAARDCRRDCDAGDTPAANVMMQRWREVRDVQRT